MVGLHEQMKSVAVCCVSIVGDDWLARREASYQWLDGIRNWPSLYGGGTTLPRFLLNRVDTLVLAWLIGTILRLG